MSTHSLLWPSRPNSQNLESLLACLTEYFWNLKEALFWVLGGFPPTSLFQTALYVYQILFIPKYIFTRDSAQLTAPWHITDPHAQAPSPSPWKLSTLKGGNSVFHQAWIRWCYWNVLECREQNSTADFSLGLSLLYTLTETCIHMFKVL